MIKSCESDNDDFFNLPQKDKVNIYDHYVVESQYKFR